MQSKYLNFNQAVQDYALSSGALRRFLLHRKKNGLTQAVLKTGRKILFNRKRFEAWLESFAETKPTKKNQKIGGRK